MLILRFKKSEKFTMEIEGKKIEVWIGGYTKTKYVVGVNAPQEVKIIRENAKVKEPKAAE